MHTLYISTQSPYSMKASALIGYSGVACKVQKQTVINRFAVIKKLTGSTMVPVLRDGDWALNDSTHIARHVMTLSTRPMLPGIEELHPLCWLMEEFADEWLSRWVVHSRWSHQEDTAHMKTSIGRELTGGVPIASTVLGRQVARLIKKKLRKAGVRSENLLAMEQSRDRTLQALEGLFSKEQPDYLFESYPTVADFSFFGQLGQYHSDPTGRRVLADFAGLVGYIKRLEAMILPRPDVELGLAPEPRDLTELEPLFAELMGTYWQVLTANFLAHGRSKKGREVSATLLDGTSFIFHPAGYSVGRLKALLAMIDEAYGQRAELFGGHGMALESALLSQIARLAEQAEGRQLLRDYPSIGLK